MADIIKFAKESVIDLLMDMECVPSPLEKLLTVEIKTDQNRTYDAVVYTTEGHFRIGAERDHHHKGIADLYAILDAYMEITSSRLLHFSEDLMVPRDSATRQAQCILRSIFTDPGKHRCSFSLRHEYYGPFDASRVSITYTDNRVFDWESLCENVHPALVAELQTHLTDAVVHEGVLSFLF